MAIICDMAKGRLADRRYFLESFMIELKIDFTRNKMSSCYIQMISLYTLCGASY